MNASFFGTGWAFPLSRDTGGIKLAVNERSIQEAIRIILGTSPGERLMRPDFGCGIHDLVFSVNSSSLTGRLEQRVRDALTRWEPRIDLLDVRVSSMSKQPTTMLIHIEYRVRSTNNRFNLVYPFYLGESAT